MFADYEVTYADCAFHRLDSGKVAVGVQLSTRSRIDDVHVSYGPYAVISGLYDVAAGSIRQSVPVVAADIVQTARPGTKLIIIRSSSGSFMRKRSLEKEIGLLAAGRGIEVKLSHKPRLYRVVPDLLRITNDAIERGSTVIAAV
ncbi:hypothetical protein GCM10023310_54270 [Paenibacillus vulneris]|uniref:Uncharacterized protein n=1 Tax=Paenibacillus vulneris TaxID=1133364 RepID=A0ABW3UX54_9BACL